MAQKTQRGQGECSTPAQPTNGLRLVRLHGAGNAVQSKRATFVGMFAYGLKNGDAPLRRAWRPIRPLLVGIAARKAHAGASPCATEIVQPVGSISPSQRRHCARDALKLAGRHVPGLVAEKQLELSIDRSARPMVTWRVSRFTCPSAK